MHERRELPLLLLPVLPAAPVISGGCDTVPFEPEPWNCSDARAGPGGRRFTSCLPDQSTARFLFGLQKRAGVLFPDDGY
jgi:hypothetical protein